MCAQSIKDLINSYETFYHITTSENAEKVREIGIIPTTEKLVDENYNTYTITQCCLTIREHIESLKQTIATGGKTCSVFVISASLVATKNVGIDKTHSAYYAVDGLEELPALQYMIETAGTLACFEPILASELQQIE
jgi:hypothetical protein